MSKLLRIVDVNLNRSREGLRVCEDIARFALDDAKLSRSFKSLRHSTGALAKKIYGGKTSLLKSRSVKTDVGRSPAERERGRKDLRDVFRANIQRVKESLRVLEEIIKITDKKAARRFKKIRFRTYELEKKSRVKLETLLHN